MSGPSTVLPPRAELASRVAELNDLVVFGAFEDDELRRLTRQVDDLLESAGSSRQPWWESAEPDRAYRARSPFAGSDNPRAPHVVFAAGVDDDGRPTMVAEVTLDKAYAGPPGAVHGGMLAGLFDEVIGAAAGAAAPGRVVVTGKLTVRYRTPTPLRIPLRIEAAVTRRSNRLLPVVARCEADGRLTATAEALMVLR